jgi:hypothetical protein
MALPSRASLPFASPARLDGYAAHNNEERWRNKASRRLRGGEDFFDWSGENLGRNRESFSPQVRFDQADRVCQDSGGAMMPSGPRVFQARNWFTSRPPQKISDYLLTTEFWIKMEEFLNEVYA